MVGSTESDAKVFASGLNAFYYSVPAAYKDDKGNLKSTGSAASECKDVENADDPCHWNKLYPDDATEIPLYIESSGAMAFRK